MTPDPRESRESRDPRDPWMSSKKLKFAVIYHTLAHVAPPKTSPDPSPGLRAAQEGLQEHQEGLEELIFDEISVVWVQAGYFGCGKNLAGYFGRGKTLGGLFWLRKNLGGRYFGCGKAIRTRTF